MTRITVLTMGLLLGIAAVAISGCQSVSKTESMALTGSSEAAIENRSDLGSHRTPKGDLAFDRS